MRLYKVTEEYVADSEQEAINLIEAFRKDAEEKGYILSFIGIFTTTKNISFFLCIFSESFN